MSAWIPHRSRREPRTTWREAAGYWWLLVAAAVLAALLIAVFGP